MEYERGDDFKRDKKTSSNHATTIYFYFYITWMLKKTTSPRMKSFGNKIKK